MGIRQPNSSLKRQFGAGAIIGGLVFCSVQIICCLGQEWRKISKLNRGWSVYRPRAYRSRRALISVEIRNRSQNVVGSGVPRHEAHVERHRERGKVRLGGRYGKHGNRAEVVALRNSLVAGGLAVIGGRALIGEPLAVSDVGRRSGGGTWLRI